jgi:hypothetical protein
MTDARPNLATKRQLPIHHYLIFTLHFHFRLARRYIDVRSTAHSDFHMHFLLTPQQTKKLIWLAELGIAPPIKAEATLELSLRPITTVVGLNSYNSHVP